MLSTIYDQCFLVHASSLKQEVMMYKLKGDTFSKDSIFNLFSLGHLQYSIVDSIFIVHNSLTKLSMIYDVACKYENPLTYPAAIQEYKPYSIQEELKENEPTSVHLYSDKWKYLLPDLILDTDSGFIFELHLLLNAFPFRAKLKKETDLEHVKFLSRRIGGKWKLLETVRNFCVEKPLICSIEIFQFICRVYLQWILTRVSKDQQIYDDEGEWSYVGKEKTKPEQVQTKCHL